MRVEHEIVLNFYVSIPWFHRLLPQLQWLSTQGRDLYKSFCVKESSAKHLTLSEVGALDEGVSNYFLFSAAELRSCSDPSLKMSTFYHA